MPPYDWPLYLPVTSTNQHTVRTELHSGSNRDRGDFMSPRELHPGIDADAGSLQDREPAEQSVVTSVWAIRSRSQGPLRRHEVLASRTGNANISARLSPDSCNRHQRSRRNLGLPGGRPRGFAGGFRSGREPRASISPGHKSRPLKKITAADPAVAGPGRDHAGASQRHPHGITPPIERHRAAGKLSDSHRR